MPHPYFTCRIRTLHAASVLCMPDAQCSLPPLAGLTLVRTHFAREASKYVKLNEVEPPNALKHGFYSRRFSNYSFYNRCFSNRRFYDRCLSGQERLDLEFLVYRPSSTTYHPLSVIRHQSSFVYRQIIRSSSFRDYFLLKNN